MDCMETKSGKKTDIVSHSSLDDFQQRKESCEGMRICPFNHTEQAASRFQNIWSQGDRGSVSSG